MVTRYLSSFEGLSGVPSSGKPSFVDGVVTNADNLDLGFSPGLEVDAVDGDYELAIFYSRDVTDGDVSASVGWEKIYQHRDSGGLLAIFSHWFEAGEDHIGPQLNLENHSAGDSVIMALLSFRNVRRRKPIEVIGAVSTNASAQNIGAISGITLPANHMLLVIGGKLDDWTSVATLSQTGLTFTEAIERSNTLGNDNGLVIDYATADDGAEVAITDKTFTVTGGASAAGKGIMLALAPEEGYTFPLASYEMAVAQALETPRVKASGADYAVRLNGMEPGLKEVGRAAVRFKLADDSASDLNTARDDIGAILHRIGLGKLFLSDGRWCYASLASMPEITLRAGSPNILPTVLEFEMWSDFFGAEMQTHEETIEEDGQEWVIENPGPLPVTEMVLVLEPNGAISAVKVTNLTNGYEFEITDSLTATEHVRLDTMPLTGPRMLIFDNTTDWQWEDGFGEYELPPSTQPVLSFRLEPGENRLRLTGASADLVVHTFFWPKYGVV